MTDISSLNIIKIKQYLESNKQILDNGCWILKNRNTATYHYYLGIGVHRLSASIYKNLPLNKNILHKCDNPPCWNPDHLFEGRQSKNLNDAIEKNRIILGRKFNKIKPTHCPQNHEYTETNTKYNRGKMYCVECRRIRDRERNKDRKIINGIRLRKSQLEKRELL